MSKLADTYYRLKLVPIHIHLDHNVEVYVKGKNLALFLADIADDYQVKVHQVNHDGFILRYGEES